MFFPKFFLQNFFLSIFFPNCLCQHFFSKLFFQIFFFFSRALPSMPPVHKNMLCSKRSKLNLRLVWCVEYSSSALTAYITLDEKSLISLPFCRIYFFAPEFAAKKICFIYWSYPWTWDQFTDRLLAEYWRIHGPALAEYRRSTSAALAEYRHSTRGVPVQYLRCSGAVLAE